MKVCAFLPILLAFSVCHAAFAQDATPPAGPPPQVQAAPGTGAPGGGQRGGGRGGWAGGGMGRGLIGTVTEVAADHYTVKTEAGETYTVHYSVNTRILKQPARPAGGGGGGEGGPGGGNPPTAIKPTDIKVGDAIATMGEVDATAKSVGAVAVIQIDPERAKQMREMQANHGKTWYMGKVTAIDGVKITLTDQIDNAPHSVVADENTTFRKRRDPITLADIQVGDNIRVEGAVKGDSFVATTVNALGQPPAPGAGPGQHSDAPQPQ
jgi:Domain of unknown function (DUF5666)